MLAGFLAAKEGTLSELFREAWNFEGSSGHCVSCCRDLSLRPGARTQ